MIVPSLSNSAQAADPIAQAAKTVVFGTSNTADGITSIGDYVFRNSVTEADVLRPGANADVENRFPDQLTLAGVKVSLSYEHDPGADEGNDEFEHADPRQEQGIRRPAPSGCRSGRESGGGVVRSTAPE